MTVDCVNWTFNCVFAWWCDMRLFCTLWSDQPASQATDYLLFNIKNFTAVHKHYWLPARNLVSRPQLHLDTGRTESSSCSDKLWAPHMLPQSSALCLTVQDTETLLCGRMLVSGKNMNHSACPARRKHKHVILPLSLNCTIVSFCSHRYITAVDLLCMCLYPGDSWYFSCCNKPISPEGSNNLISSCSSKKRSYAFLLVFFKLFSGPWVYENI